MRLHVDVSLFSGWPNKQNVLKVSVFFRLQTDVCLVTLSLLPQFLLVLCLNFLFSQFLDLCLDFFVLIIFVTGLR